MGRRRKGILGGGKGISKCAKSSLKVGDKGTQLGGAGSCLQSMTTLWRVLRSLEETELSPRETRTFYS